MGRANITVEIHLQEYNMYFRAIRQTPEAPNRKCSYFFAVGFLGAGTIGMADITVETHFHEYITYYRTIGQMPVALIHRVLMAGSLLQNGECQYS